MPGFWGHTLGSGVAATATTAYMVYDHWSSSDILVVNAGIALATFVLSPDMDLFNSRPNQGWGVLRIFWWPYSKLVKHRDRLHIPVIGTTARFLYTALILSVFIILFRYIFRRIGLQIDFDFEGDRADMIYNLLFLVDVYVGAVIADATHYVLDIVTTEIKMSGRLRRPRQASGLEHEENHQHGADEWNRNWQNSKNDWRR
ncbi:MAG: DUF2227 family putative metal-binding protein [Chloroflexi bacterium]|nr:DUF2227 family putative metal-binding protein [Chloroflexota bacterium]